MGLKVVLICQKKNTNCIYILFALQMQLQRVTNKRHKSYTYIYKKTRVVIEGQELST